MFHVERLAFVNSQSLGSADSVLDLLFVSRVRTNNHLKAINLLDGH